MMKEKLVTKIITYRFFYSEFFYSESFLKVFLRKPRKLGNCWLYTEGLAQPYKNKKKGMRKKKEDIKMLSFANDQQCTKN